MHVRQFFYCEEVINFLSKVSSTKKIHHVPNEENMIRNSQWRDPKWWSFNEDEVIKFQIVNQFGFE